MSFDGECVCACGGKHLKLSLANANAQLHSQLPKCHFQTPTDTHDISHQHWWLFNIEPNIWFATLFWTWSWSGHCVISHAALPNVHGRPTTIRCVRARLWRQQRIAILSLSAPSWLYCEWRRLWLPILSAARDGSVHCAICRPPRAFCVYAGVFRLACRWPHAHELKASSLCSMWVYVRALVLVLVL